MKRKYIIFIAIFALLVAVGLYFGLPLLQTEQEGTWTPIEVTQTNVASIMSRTSLIADMPSEANIAVYIGDVGYSLTAQGMHEEAPASPDVTLRLPLSYLATMGKYGPCHALAAAKASGNLGIELHESSTSLAWKYRSLGKYRSCLG